MTIEPSGPSPLRVEPIRRGDFVDVWLTTPINSGLCAFIAKINDARLDLRVHCAFGAIDGAGDPFTCLGWAVSVPWSSVLFVKQAQVQPKDCTCHEGLTS